MLSLPPPPPPPFLPRLLKNISAGTRNLKRKEEKKNRKELRERKAEALQLELANLAEFIFYFISVSGKLSCSCATIAMRLT